MARRETDNTEYYVGKYGESLGGAYAKMERNGLPHHSGLMYPRRVDRLDFVNAVLDHLHSSDREQQVLGLEALMEHLDSRIMGVGDMAQRALPHRMR